MIRVVVQIDAIIPFDHNILGMEKMRMMRMTNTTTAGGGVLINFSFNKIDHQRD